jgi:integrase
MGHRPCFFAAEAIATLLAKAAVVSQAARVTPESQSPRVEADGPSHGRVTGDSSRSFQGSGYPCTSQGNVRHIRFHDLRHTYVSVLLMFGANLISVQKLLGHSDPKITATGTSCQTS